MSHRLLDTVFYNTPGAANPLSAPSPPPSPARPFPGSPLCSGPGPLGGGGMQGPVPSASPRSLLRAGLRLALVTAVGVLISQGLCGAGWGGGLPPLSSRGGLEGARPQPLSFLPGPEPQRGGDARRLWVRHPQRPGRHGSTQRACATSDAGLATCQ